MSAPGRKRSDGMPEPRRHEFVDLYELLEVSPHASVDVIQAAYRILARNYHPDVNASAEAGVRIRQLNAAYSVLSNAQDRARYDLECARVRRNERITQVKPGGVMTAVSGFERSGVLATRRTLARPAPLERTAILSGQAVVGLILVGAMAAFLLIVLWATLDAGVDYPAAYAEQTVQWSGR
jgi:DnaJ-domain-containing protein 1